MIHPDTLSPHASALTPGISHKRQVGILGGSFNPAHAGHIMLASFIAQFTSLSQVWLMLSPDNPLKQHRRDSTDAQRLEMLRLAVAPYPFLRACDIELSMPRPSYTIHSLSRLAELHPDTHFRLIIGSDNWLIFDRWASHLEIIDRFAPIIYPRPGYPVDPLSLPEGVELIEAPTIDISSTFIRQSIADGHDMTAFLPPHVARYIRSNNLYRP